MPGCEVRPVNSADTGAKIGAYPPRSGLRCVDVGCGTGWFPTATTAEMAALQLSQTTVSA